MNLNLQPLEKWSRQARSLTYVPDRNSLLEALRIARKSALQRAEHALAASGDGLACARQISADMDAIVLALCELVSMQDATGWPNQLVLCAIGGYGRGELAPGSDLDLLFLVKKTPTKASTKIIEIILYLLWDSGLKVGHCVRSQKECVQMAKQDHSIATGLLDLRQLFGREKPVQQLRVALSKKPGKKAIRKFVADKLQERDQRHNKAGPTRYMVEPNVKDGKGGLRDLQSLVWIAQKAAPDAVMAGGRQFTFFNASQARIFERAHRFLWTVRCGLHFLSERDEDRLSFDLQPALARKLGYRSTATKPGVERLLKAYFLHARDVGFLTRVFCAKLEEQANKRAPGGLSGKASGHAAKKLSASWVLRNDRLDFAAKPTQQTMLDIFIKADQTGLDLHPDALQKISDRQRKIKRSEWQQNCFCEALLKIVSATKNPERLLRLMNETALLGRLIPEFGHIVARAQFNMYHSYTVDEHTLRAMGELQKLLDAPEQQLDDGQLPVFDKISSRMELMLAMLLHDTGKGEGDQQIEGGKAAHSACTRLGLDDGQRDLVVWLVENHLLFSETAQGRDLGDPKTVQNFAKHTGSLERLRMLLALTIADMKAVGPGVWTSWKGQLLMSLYMQSENYLRGRVGFGQEDQIATIKKRLSGQGATQKFWKSWLANMPARYWLEFPEKDLLQQAKMVQRAKKDHRVFAFDLTVDSESRLTILGVWAKDRPGLFADLCLLARASHAGVASASIFTGKDGYALDVFALHDGRGGAFGAANPRAIERLAERMQNYLQSGNLPDTPPLAPTARQAVFSVLPEVVIDNDASARATLVECAGADRSGILQQLAQTFNLSAVNIHSAHIMTFGERAVDVFYVNEANGLKITSGTRKKALRKKLLAVLSARPAAKTTRQILPAQASRHQ